MQALICDEFVAAFTVRAGVGQSWGESRRVELYKAQVAALGARCGEDGVNDHIQQNYIPLLDAAWEAFDAYFE